MTRKKLVLSILVSSLLVVSVAIPLFSLTPVAIAAPEREELSFEMWTLDWDTISVDAGDVIEQMLRDIGIRMKALPLSDEVLYDNLDLEHTYEVYEMSHGFQPYPGHLYFRLHSDEIMDYGGNFPGYSNPQFDSLIDRANKELDFDKRKKLLWQAQELLAQDLPYIPLFTSGDIHAIRKEWTGYHYLPGGIFNWYNRLTTIDLRHEDQEYGADFIMAYPSFIWYYNPIMAGDGRSLFVISMVFDALVSYDDDMNLTPWLATDWTVSTDGLTITFNLVQNAKWHDGVALTAEDVKFTIDYYKEQEAPYDLALMNRIESVETDGDYSVIVHMKEPYAWVLYDFEDVPIIPKHIWQDKTWDWAVHPDAMPIGSGPFKWDSYVDGEWIKLVANPDYWMTGKPHLGSFTIRVISESSARFLAIKTGEVHSERYELDIGFIKAAERSDELTPLEDTWCVGMWDYVISFNQRTDPALQDPVVKQAIAYAIDKEKLVEIARLGYGTVTETFIPSAFFGPAYENPDATTYEYNVFLANKILDTAGYLDIDADGIREMPAPALDRDGDGIPDDLDACPDIAGLPEYGGCPGEVETLEKLVVISNYSSTSGTGEYKKGLKATFKVSNTIEFVGPSKRYKFVGWISESSGGYTGPNNPAEVVMNNDITEIAQWKIQYMLTVTSLVDVEGGGWYDDGETTTLRAMSPQGFIVQQVFKGWSGDIESGSDTVSVVMDGPKTIVAEWTRDYTQLYLLGGVVSVIVISSGAYSIQRRRRERRLRARAELKERLVGEICEASEAMSISVIAEEHRVSEEIVRQIIDEAIQEGVLAGKYSNDGQRFITDAALQNIIRDELRKS